MTRKKFDYTLDYKHLDLRKHPELYVVGIGEQGVLLVEPYKSEILLHWRFRTPEIARESAEKIYHLFLEYLKNQDFVGADMARKFLQMGYTRSRRYANHSSGKKYSISPYSSSDHTMQKKNKKTTTILPQNKDWNTNEKAQSARVFYSFYKKAKENDVYILLKQEHVQKYNTL